MAVETYCPMCGSPLEWEPELSGGGAPPPGGRARAQNHNRAGPVCEVCRVVRGEVSGALRQIDCRRCGAAVARGSRVCDECGAANPTSYAGVPPVGQLALGFTVLAVVILILNLCFGPIGL